MATSKARDEDLTCNLDRIILVGSLVESVLNAIDDLVSYLEVFLRYLLILVHLLH